MNHMDEVNRVLAIAIAITFFALPGCGTPPPVKEAAQFQGEAIDRSIEDTRNTMIAFRNDLEDEMKRKIERKVHEEILKLAAKNGGKIPLDEYNKWRERRLAAVSSLPEKVDGWNRKIDRSLTNLRIAKKLNNLIMQFMDRAAIRPLTEQERREFISKAAEMASKIKEKKDD